MTERDDQHAPDGPVGETEADTTRDAPLDLPDLTDDQGLPLDNPSGG